MRLRKYPYKKYLLLVAALFLLLSLPSIFFSGWRGRSIAAVSLLKKKQAATFEQVDLLYAPQSKSWNKMDIHAVEGHVIYRDPVSFSSSVWIDIGAKTSSVIEKNSPVVVGHFLVGVIDYVGKNQSRVRLITDVALKPSVRVSRGYEQNLDLVEYINPVIEHLEKRKNLPLSNEEQKVLGKTLVLFKERLLEKGEQAYLAKGILQGSGAPLWRSMNQTLRGIGFNYDFSDDKGEARSLFSKTPIIEENDLLVTTGLDGVFPEGLVVAYVSKIFPLKEGDYTYEIEAIPSAPNLNSLQTVFVIPRLGYEVEDQPEGM